MLTSDARVMAYANMATEELIQAGNGTLWPCTVDRLKFTLNKCTFVLPSDYDRMLYCTVDGTPLATKSPYYEFVGVGLDLINNMENLPASGYGYIRAGWYQGVIDKDTAATFQEIPVDGNTYYPRVYGQTDERVDGVRPSIVIQGYDNNGQWIRTSDGGDGFIDGVSIPINGDTAPYYIQSTQAFSYITGTIKPVTKKNVMVYASTVDGSIMWYLAQYAAGDTTPLFRQYSIPQIRFANEDESRTRTVIARCLRRYVPIRSDADFLIISNLPALKAMVQAVYYRDDAEPELSTKYRQMAVQLLREEAKSYIGLSQQKPILTLGEGAVAWNGVQIL